ALRVPQWIAFAQPPRPSFEVASVKPADPNDPRFGIRIQPGGRFTITNGTLEMLVGFAFEMPPAQISGGPKWLNSENFTIEAKVDSSTPLPQGNAGFLQLSLMLQSLLAQRFKLSVHKETREAPVYELLVAKGGPKLKPAEASGKPPGRRMGRGELTG